MKRLVLGALVAALCVAPGVSRAETQRAPASAAAPAAREAQDAEGSGEAADDASEYAEREKAAPELAEFEGGADGVYISAGAIAVALLVVLLIVAL